MAQLPDVDHTNTNSLMDEMKVNPTQQQSETKWNDDAFNDNDSLKNHVDSNDIRVDDDMRHCMIQNRDNAPEPPSNLTMATLQDFDDANPPQNMLADSDLMRSKDLNSSQPTADLGIGDMLGSFATHNAHENVPEMLIGPLIEMGFNRKKAIYALQQSERMLGTMTVEYALQWLFENPDFEVQNTDNITATINHMIGDDLLGLNTAKKNNNEALHAPNNSPQHHSTDKTDTFLYDLLENTAHEMTNKSQSKSNRIYKHSGTLASAATENKQHDDELGANKRRASTVTSELSALSNELATNNTIKSTKEQIHKLYLEQNAQDAINRTLVSADMIATDLKMVLVVRKDLKMSCGKIAAQCCHGCIGVVMDIMNKQHIEEYNAYDNNVYDLRLILRLWRMNGEKKIVLQCANEQKLLQLKNEALIKKLPHYLVCDAGHTQIKANSKTVLAIGPYPSIEIDKLTKQLKLY